jgi:two-component system sensor kinase FixL
MGALPQASPCIGVELDYRAIFDAAPGLYLLLDRELTIITANQAYCRATMTDVSRIAGRPLFEIFPDNPGDPNADGVRNLKASLERVLRDKQPDAMPVQKYDIRNADGEFEERHWSPLNTPVIGRGGEVAFIIHRVEDVTELVRLENQTNLQNQIARDQQHLIGELRHTLRENARLEAGRLYLGSIVESSHDPIIATDLDGTVTAWNRAAERVFGYKSEEILGRAVSLLFPTFRAQENQELLERVVQGERISRFATQRRAKDGSVLDVQLTLAPIRDSAGAIVGVSKIVEDVTEQLLAEHQMRRLQADRGYLADIVESSNDAIIARTTDGRVASWNKAATRLFGYSAAEIMGMSVDLLLPPELQGESDAVFERLRSGEAAIHYETTRLRKDGSPILVSITVSPVLDQDGHIKGSSAIVRDITEQKRADERFRNLQAELIHLSRWNTMGMMASTIAHELNQPLTASVNYVRAARRILSGDPPDPVRAGTFLDKAVEENKLAGGIIRSLREFIDKRETIRAPENLNKVVEEAISLSLAGGPDSKIQLTVRLASLLPQVLVDKIQIEQVLLNLIRNATDAMNGRGTIAIVTEIDSGFVRVSVSDSGPGIAPEITPSLFQPFVTTKEKGMGIGLTICQSIIEAHGGRIWAENGAESGAVFHFRLPGAEAPL